MILQVVATGLLTFVWSLLAFVWIFPERAGSLAAQVYKGFKKEIARLGTSRPSIDERNL